MSSTKYRYILIRTKGKLYVQYNPCKKSDSKNTSLDSKLVWSGCANKLVQSENIVKGLSQPKLKSAVLQFYSFILQTLLYKATYNISKKREEEGKTFGK